MGSEEIGSNILIEISDHQRCLEIDHPALEGLIRTTLTAQGVDQASISIVLVDDTAIREINRRTLGHDWATDVVTFPLSDPSDTELTGELVVSAEMAVTTSKEADIAPWSELALYVVHGLLHLCGYDDQSPDDRAAMRQREAEILSQQGLINPFPLVGLDEAEDCLEPERPTANCNPPAPTFLRNDSQESAPWAL